jgi:hypothetical protein
MNAYEDPALDPNFLIGRYRLGVNSRDLFSYVFIKHDKLSVLMNRYLYGGSIDLWFECRKYLTNNLAYGESGHRDEDKQMEDLIIGQRRGRLHFIRYRYN